MKRTMVLIVFYFICLLLWTDLSAQSFSNIFVPSAEGIRSTEFTGLIEVPGGFIATGYIDTFYNGNYGMGRIWAAKVSPTGNIIWSRFYRDVDPLESWWGRKAANADNDGVYILGDNQAHNGFVLKLDKNGEVVWRKDIIVTPNNSWANDLISTPDGGCLAVGYTVTSDTAAYVKLDKNGAITFSKKYKPETDHSLRLCGVDRAFDGGYYIAGIQREFYPIWKERFLVVKISESGQLLWRKTYHGGSYTIDDKKQSNGYTISALPNGGFIAGGYIIKEDIFNQQAYLMRGDDNGDTLWTKVLFEELYPFPEIGVDNTVSKVTVKNNRIYSEFVETEGTSTAKNFLVSLNVSDGAVNWKQTGYILNDQHTRGFNRILQNGQPCFIGGEFYINYPKHGLILATTPDGLWIPPTIAKFEGGVDQPELVTRVTGHIEVKRVVQVSKDIDFNVVAYEKSNITSDTVQLDLTSLDDGKYYLRVGIIGALGNTIWADVMEIFMFSTLNLRYADQVTAYSTQYGGGWSATEILGAPNVYPNYGDHTGTWSPSTADGQREFLECSFPNASTVSGIIIFETYNPGNVDTVYVRNPNTQKWDIVYSVTAAPAPEFARALAVSFPVTPFPVTSIRIACNSPAVPGYNEIDAIGLFDATFVGTSDIQERLERLKISPNPAKDMITISWNTPLSIAAECMVFDVNGRKFLEDKISAGNKEWNLDIADLPSGSYLILLKQSGSVQSVLFSKE